ncbi:Transposase DDE domain protein [Tautonia plasticadhaerens]|uniref:Transposase DDE domain protein n=2 Tax=Tautonia plasticadhaerens TaxID=2527974 RepID=A0A518H1Q5_9BACT|nr:Transposase DDE domain protein [Tautonia plasticadhaerens]
MVRSGPHVPSTDDAPGSRPARPRGEPYRPRTSASLDSQSVDTTSGGERRGRDNPEDVGGRERHIVVDRMGLLLAVLVTAVSVDDAAAAPALFARLDGRPMGKVRGMCGDSKEHDFTLYEWVEEHAKWDLEVIRRPEGSRGRGRLPIRRTVERTFAWLGRCRRLSVDRERCVRSSESFIELAMIRLMLHRLEPSDVDPEFRDPRPVAA